MRSHLKNVSAASTFCPKLNIFTLSHAQHTYWTTPYKDSIIYRNLKHVQGCVYLGPSQNHSRTVHLILNPRTGHVSPQYHVKHDDFFKSVAGKSSNFDSPEPTWKRLSGFMKNDHKSEPNPIGGATSPTPIDNTTRLDDLNDITLCQEPDQDQRETSLDNPSENTPNYARHQSETVPHGSEGETATDTTPNPNVTTRSGRNV